MGESKITEKELFFEDGSVKLGGHLEDILDISIYKLKHGMYLINILTEYENKWHGEFYFEEDYNLIRGVCFYDNLDEYRFYVCVNIPSMKNMKIDADIWKGRNSICAYDVNFEDMKKIKYTEKG